jgi:hypothetical protein
MALSKILGIAAMAGLAASSGASGQKCWFACRVSGEKLLSPQMSAKTVCDRLHQSVNRALRTPAVSTNKLSDHDRAHANWIELDVRFSRPGTATARLARRSGVQVTRYPEFAIDVSDRPLDAATIETLSREIEKRIKARA